MVIICVFVTGIAVLAGFGFGLRALSLAKTHLEASSLKLMAWNLIEPSVTLAISFVILAIMGGMLDLKDETIFVVPAIALISLTWMLLAPLWTKTTHPIRGIIIMYGVLRWLNTVAFWIVGAMALTQTSSNDLLMLASGLIVFGTIILCLSVTHLASSLSDFQVKATVTPADS
jgi:uncharacterized membrane protein YidH (DUF202 family)